MLVRSRLSRLILLSAGLAGLVLTSREPARAGSGRYDPEGRVFHLTYCYTDVPARVGASPGQARRVTRALDDRVRAVVEDVSRVLYTITDGRSRIGTFELILDPGQADVIVSPTGDPGRAAWAHVGALGSAGHMVFYAAHLEKQRAADIALTAAHELCHYLFALPDEYPPGAPGCPFPAQGPGCLMDNYWREGGRGWYQRLCDSSDHNGLIPVRHEGLAFDSCRDLVDHYFESRGVEAVPPTVVMLDETRLMVAVQETARRARRSAEVLRRNQASFPEAQLHAHVRALLAAALRERDITIPPDELAAAARLILRVAGFPVNATPELAVGELAHTDRSRFVEIAARAVREPGGAGPGLVLELDSPDPIDRFFHLPLRTEPGLLIRWESERETLDAP